MSPKEHNYMINPNALSAEVKEAKQTSGKFTLEYNAYT